MRKSIAAILIAVTFPMTALADPDPAPDASRAVTVPSDPMLAPVTEAPLVVRSWNEAITLVRSRSLDYGVALDEVEKAQGLARVALAAALPTLDASATATHQLIAPPATTVGGTTVQAARNTLQAGMTLSVPLVDVAAWHAYDVARDNVHASEASADDQRRLVVVGVVDALVAEATAQRVSEINRVGLSDALVRLGLVENKKLLGADSQLDLLRARQDVVTARTALIKGDDSLKDTREALALALGEPRPVSLGVGLDVAAIEAGALHACTGAPVADRPDVAAARRALEVADRSVTSVDLQFLPTLSASSTLGVIAEDAGTSPVGSWNVQGVLSWSIWDGGVRYGLLHQARASASEAQRKLDAVGRSARIDVEQKTREVEVAGQSVRLATEARDTAAEVDRLTRVAYAEGAGTSLDLITAATALRQAEINVAVEEVGSARARIQAALATATCKL